MTKRIAPWLVGAIAIVAAVLAFALWYLLRPPYAVRELPDEASDVHYLERDMFPDWSFSMSAALPEAACRTYVADALGELEPFDGPTVEANVGAEEASWAWGWSVPADGGSDRGPWWHPGPVDEHPTWYANEGGAWELVQCSQGRVFYESFSH